MTWHKHLSLTDHKHNEVREFLIYRQNFFQRPALFCVVNDLGTELAERFSSITDAVKFLEERYSLPKD